MNDSRTLHTLMHKLVHVRDEMRQNVAISKPPRVSRDDLEGYLHFTHAELLEMFHESGRNMRHPLRLAIIVLARIDRGADCYGNIALAAHCLIKAMHPIYLGRLKRHERKIVSNQQAA